MVELVAFCLGNLLSVIFDAAGAAALGVAAVAGVMVFQGLQMPAIVLQGLNI